MRGFTRATGSAVRHLLGRNRQSALFRASAAVLAVSLVASIGGRPAAATPVPQSLPAAVALGQPTILWPDQGWTADERALFHHQSQGTLTLPIPASWLLAFQQPGDIFDPNMGMFSDPAYLQRFGFIPSPQGPTNPDGMPIGFARTAGTDPNTGKPFDQFGFTCAACHTARIDYRATTILIDGGPAMIDLTAFGTQMVLALAETYASSLINAGRFDRFAKRVLGANDSPQERAKLKLAMKQVIDSQLPKNGSVAIGGFIKSLGNVSEGPGRLDALNRIGNTVFGGDLKLPQNNAATSAPVAYPHIWDISWFAWVQYNGSIERPMVRNAGEAMGVNAAINLTGSPTSPRFTSTIPIDKLYDPIEHLLAGPKQPQDEKHFTGLRSPAWPSAVLGAPDPALLARGAQVYHERCESCHLPAPNTPEFWSDPHWTQPNAAGERYLDLPMIPISVVGTDPAQAEDMKNRSVWVPTSIDMGDVPSTGTKGNLKRYAFGPALGRVVELVVAQWYDANGISPADRDRMNGYRPNGIRAPLAYKARPLDGIWATGPYLHNGSVRTLWELVSPYNVRKPFHMGSTNFDPAWVGYIDERGPLLNTAQRGNRNTGHLFDSSLPKRAGTLGPEIPEADRWALLAYLKTL